MRIVSHIVIVAVLALSSSHAWSYSSSERGVETLARWEFRAEARVIEKAEQTALVYYPTDEEEMGFGRIDSAPRQN